MFKEGTFQDKRVLVTGGRSGIGYAIAESFLKLGARVCIASRNQEKLEAACLELGQHGPCTAFSLDIRDDEAVQKLATHLQEDWGGLDILVNNAGGQFPSPAEKISLNGWNAVINNNLNGTWYMTRNMALQHFIPQEKGCIINVIAGIYRGFPGMAHTGAARAGVDNLTKSLSVEWAKYGIRINAIAPGIIQTRGLDQYPPGFLENINEKIPLKRMGTAQEIADLCLFLASPMSAYTTGETIYVDGGMRLHGDIWKL